MTKILIIEDTADIRNNILDFLKSEDFEVMAADNGLAGIQLARQNHFDLILCDVMMPQLDGYAVLSELRQDSTTANIPFIFLTAKSEQSDLRQGINLGADDYITKPFTPDELKQAITAQLNRVAQHTEELKQVADKLSHLENFDALTGLPNQSALQVKYLRGSITKTDTNRRLVPFLLLGIDRFGRINDAVGYSKGNLVLQKLALRLIDFTNTFEGAGLARVSDDEFAIILPPVSNQETAVAIAQNFLKAIAQPFELEGKSILLTASIGIAFYPLAGSLEELLRTAGVALGAAKREGGNRSSIYSAPIFGLEAAKDLQLAADLHYAWERKTLQVFYQPRVDLRNKKIVGVGAVVHWEHPERGAISLPKILSVAKESGLSVYLGEWVLRTAWKQAKIWQESGIFLRVALSICEQMFTTPNLGDIIVHAYQDVGLDPRYLELEIAADTIAKAQNANAMASKLIAFQQLGFKTTISNFGIGHGSLNYLRQLALDNLKIERSLVTNTHQNTPILNGIIQMGHGLKLRVVADGVETEAQAAFLQKQKCDEIQQEQSFPAQEINRLLGKRYSLARC